MANITKPITPIMIIIWNRANIYHAFITEVRMWSTWTYNFICCVFILNYLNFATFLEGSYTPSGSATRISSSVCQPAAQIVMLPAAGRLKRNISIKSLLIHSANCASIKLQTEKFCLLLTFAWKLVGNGWNTEWSQMSSRNTCAHVMCYIW